jgi:O-antigen ligase/tetratricopeptide (TPR) repeat protein
MTFNSFLRWLGISALFAAVIIPLIVTASLFFPYITGKNIIFRVLAEIAFGSWAILAFRDRRYRLPFSWLTALYGVFLIVLAIADIHGVEPAKSFWSNFERMEGWVTHLHLFLYFIAAVGLFSGEKIWNAFFQTSLGVSIIVGIYGLQELATTSRINSTLGNADYLAVYMLFNIFFALMLIGRSQGKKFIQSCYGVIILFDAIVLYYTATRGVILGLGFGLFLAAVFIALFGKTQPKLRKASSILIGVLVVIVVGFLGIRNTSFVRSNPVLGRFASISVNDGTTRSRLMIWSMAFQGFKEKPLIGWGQENFNYVFAQYYNPKMYDQEPWFDRTHNVFLDWLIDGGILGLLLYLSLFGTALYYIWRKEHHHFFFMRWLHRSEENPFSIVDKSLLTGLLGGYFFQNLFVFDNVVSYLLFFSILAYIVSAYRSKAPVEKYSAEQSSLSTIATVLIVLLVGTGIYFTAIRPWVSSSDLIYAMEPQSTGLQTNIDLFEASLSNGMGGDLSEIREQFMQVSGEVAASQQVPNSTKLSFVNAAVGEMEKQLAKTPNDVRELIFYGSFLDEIGQSQSSLQYFEKARELAPGRQDVLYGLGTAYVDLKQYDQAYAAFKASYELDTEDPLAKSYYASGAVYDKHPETLQALFGTLYPHDDKVARAYLDLGDYVQAELIASEEISQDPNNISAHLFLAGAYLKEGKNAQALVELKKVEALDPSYASQLDPVISQLEGTTSAK